MAIALTIDEVHFPTKSELTIYVQNLIAQYSVGSWISESEVNFLRSLFKFHPDAERKLRGGISRIEVRLDKYGNKHFCIHDRVGNSEDISWTKCVKNARAI